MDGNVGSNGLTTAEVIVRQHRDGPNELPSPPRAGVWQMFAHQLTHLLAVLLWIAAGLALVARMPELAIAIVVIIVLNAGFAFWQEYRADRSTQELRALLPATTRVMRNGVRMDVPVVDLVVGDRVLLAAGDRVGADLRVTDSSGLAMDESLVTGESGAVPRAAGEALLGGSFVLTGEGVAVVEAIGGRTTLAEISAMTAQAERPASPLTRQLDRVVRMIAVIAAVTGVTLAVVSVQLGMDLTGHG